MPSTTSDTQSAGQVPALRSGDLLGGLEAVACMLESHELAAEREGKPYQWSPSEIVRTAIKKLGRSENALQVIMDEAQEHHEYNPIGKVARLPMGYRKILNTAHHALNA